MCQFRMTILDRPNYASVMRQDIRRIVGRVQKIHGNNNVSVMWDLDGTIRERVGKGESWKGLLTDF